MSQFRFTCGCPRTPENTFLDVRQVARCLACHRERMRFYEREKRERERAPKPVSWEGRECLLSEVWR